MSAPFVVKVPDVGEGVAEAELVDWHVEVGDVVTVDQPIVEVLTDKATVEIPSPVAGVITWRAGDPGEVVAVGSELVRIDRDGGSTTAPSADTDVAPSDDTEGGTEIEPDDGPAIAADGVDEPASNDRDPDETIDVDTRPATEQPKTERSKADTPESDPPPPRRPVTTPAAPGHHDVAARPQAAPAVRQRAATTGIDLRKVAGSGPAGRVVHGDLDAYLNGDGAARRSGSGGSRFVAAPDETDDEPIRGLRRRIAERLSDAARRIPHITYVDDLDLGPVQDLRAQLNSGDDDDRPRLTVLPFLVRAIVAAVAEYPQFNARFDDEAGVLHKHRAVHIGIATQTPNGLVVPVLRHAEGRDVFDAANEIERLAGAARNGSIAANEMSGSTITISSLGALGGLVSTPIINSPEVAIVGVNKLEQRPVWDGERFVPRPMMNLSSSFDHRIIDGWDAAQFIQHLKSSLAAPARLLV